VDNIDFYFLKISLVDTNFWREERDGCQVRFKGGPQDLMWRIDTIVPLPFLHLLAKFSFFQFGSNNKIFLKFRHFQRPEHINLEETK
jgi:hypothetical protein